MSPHTIFSTIPTISYPAFFFFFLIRLPRHRSCREARTPARRLGLLPRPQVYILDVGPPYPKLTCVWQPSLVSSTPINLSLSLGRSLSFSLPRSLSLLPPLSPLPSPSVGRGFALSGGDVAVTQALALALARAAPSLSPAALAAVVVVAARDSTAGLDPSLGPSLGQGAPGAGGAQGAPPKKAPPKKASDADAAPSVQFEAYHISTQVHQCLFFVCVERRVRIQLVGVLTSWN